MTTDQTPAASVHGGGETIKACCAVGYSSDLVSLLSATPTTPAGWTSPVGCLTSSGLPPDSRLVDVASGIGTTALLAATEYDVRADGVDLSPANVALATGAAAARGLADRATFHLGDAEALPLAGGGWDAVVCECALCTFPDKPTAVAEMARVLRPGGRIGITDMTADRDRLPPELTTLQAWIACVADARTADDYRDLLAGAGLRVLRIEQHQVALERMVRQIEARLELLRITARPRLEEAGIDFARVRPVLEAARTAVRDGILGYVLIIAEKTAEKTGTAGPSGVRA